MRRTQRDYGLHHLTFEEAARILGLETGAMMNWVMEHMSPGEARWSKWKNGKEPLPEAVIRMYLTWAAARSQSAPESPAPSAALPPVKESPRIRERRRAGGK